jgi:conjugal transfer ATP-binding protein TraC
LKKKLESTTKKFRERIQASKEIQDFTYVRDKLADNKLKITWTNNDLLIFSTKDSFRGHLKRSKYLFKGYDVATMRQSEALLNILPFQGIDYMKDLKRAGRLNRLTTINTTSMLPILAEYKGTSTGTLLVGQKNQIGFVDIFTMGANNYNAVLIGDSGAGKSAFLQKMLEYQLDVQADVYIIDNGNSHKKFTQINNGTHLTFADLKLNPFASLDKERLLRENPRDGEGIFQLQLSAITSLIALMIDSLQGVDNFRYKIIQEAVVEAYNQEANAANMDTIFDIFQRYAQANPQDRRYTDLPKEITPFTTVGIYGNSFNTNSDLDNDQNLFCLEIEGFDEKILTVVLFGLFMFISNRIYLSDKKKRKLLVIEEFWAFKEVDNPFLKAQLDKAIRTFRKHNASLITVSQQISDYFANDFVNQFYTVAGTKFIMYQPCEVLDELEKNEKMKKGFKDYEVRLLRTFKPSKEYGFSSILVKMNEFSSVHRLFLSALDKIQTTTNPLELAYIANLKKSYSLEEAIIKTAWHFYANDMQRLQNYIDLKEREGE